MSEDSSTSGANDNASGDSQETQTNKPNDALALDRKNQELLAEKRQLQAQHNELKARLDSIKDDKLASEGKKDELIESLKKKHEDASGKLNKAVGYFADKSVKSALREEAIKAGCVNVDDFIKLCDVSQIDVSDDFDVSAAQVKALVSESKKARGYLFQGKAPSVKTGTPSKPELEKDWRKLSSIDQAKLAMSLMSKNK